MKLINMKSLSRKLLTVVGVVGMLFLASCGEDDPIVVDGPSLEIASDFFSTTSLHYDGTVGDEISFTITGDVPGGFNNIKVEYLIDDADAGIDDWTDQRLSGTTVLTYTGTPTSFVLLEEHVGKEISFVITVVDDNSKTATLTLTASVASAPLESVVVTLLAAPTGDKTSKTFYSVPLARNVASSEVISSEAGTASSSDIDFGYYYTDSKGASIAAPSDYNAAVYDLGSNGQNWSTLNATTFKTTTLTPAQFIEQTTYADIETAYADGTDSGNGVNNLAVDQVIAFETVTRDSKTRKGLIRITAIAAGTESNKKIDIEVLVQK
ncbi:hypothetical protein [Reichenbachiella sp. MALMAid0571]|uniref:hypothetical protein n=1 Tax=Reichenbachiella sp. MALMAid0571 TaxID=3143939 RepID=UPI0032DEE6DF